MKKDKKRLKNCFELKEMKQAFQLNAIYDPGLHLALGQGGMGNNYKNIIGIVVEILHRLWTK